MDPESARIAARFEAVLGAVPDAAVFRALLEAAPDAMVITDAQGRIALVNAQTEKLFGYAREELLGQLVEALIPARYREAHRGHRSGYFHDPRVRPMGAGGLELLGLRRDGTEFPVEISLSPFETEQGTLAITAIRDVTDRKRAEEERARLHAQLETLLADQNRFFTNVSHELRTPLALVLGPAEKLLAAAEPGSVARADLEVIARNARTVLGHVNDLLDVAKLEAGKMATEIAEVDAARLVRISASHFEAVAADRRIAFAVETPEALPRPLDAAKLQRILLNLLSNAFKFTPEGGRIRCALREAGEGEPPGGLVLEVGDSGPGVPPEHREAIFLRFRQLEAAGRHGGTGLGLSIAKEFAELHAGRISVGDAPEGGALFRVVLPRLELPASRAEPVPAAEEEARGAADALRRRALPAGTARPGAPVILVVEDNPEMAAYVRDVLSSAASVEIASGGREGLLRAAAIGPDLVVTDLMMSGGSGEDLVREMRARPELDEVPIVVLTAKADDALRVKLLQEGAQDYVMKPFGADELRARVMGLVASKRAGDFLRRELDSQARDLDTLVLQVATRRGELEAALDAARVARDEADRASRVKGNFLALVSHELRTPITLLHLQIERLARDPHPSELQRRVMARLMGASRRLAALVEALLEHSRVSSGRVALRREAVLLRDVVEDVVEELRPQAEAKGLELSVAVARDLPAIVTDPRLVRVVAANLVGNAVKFTDAGGVLVTVSPGDDGQQRIAVTDTGPGIPDEDQARIFQPFEQRDPVHMKHLPGVGLGLALVREIAAALGARVELDSAVGKGSTFAVILPPSVEERTGFVLGTPAATA
jgi:PAS domain S-box-containing protein